jgi:signal recognition particle subunit SRP54
MMTELRTIRDTVNPDEILLVADSMTGQDAVKVATHFNETLSIDGIVLTKMDGDTRGGAAISIKAVTGKPIKYIGTGEKLDALEKFYPDRLASRILGMGDVLSLIEKVQQNVDIEEAKKMEKKFLESAFTFDDFLSQLEQLKKMGPFSQLLDMVPGISGKIDPGDIDQNALNKIEAIICSMTREERRNPRIIDGSRRKRISKGSGTTVQDVNRLIKQFEEMRKMMKRMKKMKFGKMFPGMMPFR